MCNEKTVEDANAYLEKTGQLSRRTFTSGSAAATLALMLPVPANAAEVTESEVNVPTPDGTADCYFVHPANGKHPGVIIWPDVLSLRPAFRAMAKRLAQSGYAVLVINPYYREAKAPVVAEGASFQDQETRDIVLPLAMALSKQTTMSDAGALVQFLDAQPAVDTSRQMGVMGYCMGGPFTMFTAAAVPDRIGAGASFHGGRLVVDGPDSPHLLIPQMKASFLFAIAENDDEKEPETKKILRTEYDKAGLPAEIEVYEGALHGWCPPDSRVYNEAQAERAWSRLLALFETSLT